MAGVRGNGTPEIYSASPFSRLALNQYGALMGMRFRMLANSVRSVQGAFELSARGVAFVIYTIMGIGLGLGLGAGTYSLVSNKHLEYLAPLFWIVFAVWQVLPIALASFQEQFDLSALLRFPVSFGSFYFLSIVFGLVDVPALLGAICCIGIWVGTILVRPDLAGRMALTLAFYAVFNVVLARTVLAWVDRWMAKRRTREIVSALFLVFLLSLQLLNPALRENARIERPNSAAAEASHRKMMNEIRPWITRLHGTQRWMPPGLAAGAVVDLTEGISGSFLMSLGVIGLYIIATGAVLKVRLGAEYRGERLSEANGAKKKTADDDKWLIARAGPVAAVMEKELRTIPRSMPLLFAMGAPLLTVLIISTVLKNSMDGRPFRLAFPLCVCYALLGFTQMIFNNLGAEGAGIQVLFLAPARIRSILVAKNLLHGTLFCLVAFLAAVFASLRLGIPDPLMAATTCAWVLFALPANLAAGNVLSLTMPYRVNPGRISRQRGSQASALVSMLIQAFVIGCGVAVLEICTYFGRKWLAPLCLLALAGLAGIGWLRVLAKADLLANRNRNNLIATLAKME